MWVLKLFFFLVPLEAIEFVCIHCLISLRVWTLGISFWIAFCFGFLYVLFRLTRPVQHSPACCLSQKNCSFCLGSFAIKLCQELEDNSRSLLLLSYLLLLPPLSPTFVCEILILTGEDKELIDSLPTYFFSLLQSNPHVSPSCDILNEFWRTICSVFNTTLWAVSDKLSVSLSYLL